MRGGLKVDRGSAAAARNYVEAGGLVLTTTTSLKGVGVATPYVARRGLDTDSVLLDRRQAGRRPWSLAATLHAEVAVAYDGVTVD